MRCGTPRLFFPARLKGRSEPCTCGGARGAGMCRPSPHRRTRPHGRRPGRPGRAWAHGGMHGAGRGGWGAHGPLAGRGRQRAQGGVPRHTGRGMPTRAAARTPAGTVGATPAGTRQRWRWRGYASGYAHADAVAGYPGTRARRGAARGYPGTLGGYMGTLPTRWGSRRRGRACHAVGGYATPGAAPSAVPGGGGMPGHHRAPGQGLRPPVGAWVPSGYARH